MKILISGASSFSGMWFARALAKQGNEVVAIYRRRSERDYSGIRLRRVMALGGLCRRVFGCVFGRAKFMRLVAEKPGWDVFCHHAAAVGDFRAADYDVCAALAKNTCNLPQVLSRLQDGGCRAMIATGSVFERGEGKGSDGLPAILPYGLAKTLTWQSLVFYARECQMRLAKFVIANPFGPLEEPRFTAYLAREWLGGRSAVVRTPEYLRDNIHISLLAAVYADFVCRFACGRRAAAVVRPCGYVEKQSAFARRFAREMQKRWQLPCKLNFAKQSDFAEPLVRVNTDVINAAALGWSAKPAWDAIADYYKKDKPPF